MLVPTCLLTSFLSLKRGNNILLMLKLDEDKLIGNGGRAFLLSFGKIIAQMAVLSFQTL